MSELTLYSVVMTIIQVVIIIAMILPLVKKMTVKRTGLLSVFFVLAMVSCILSDLYWITYDCIRPDTRMPFAVNEIAECSVVLLLSAGLETILEDKKIHTLEVLFSVIYVGANIALWIVWSGEWVQDIVFGIPYIFFMWVMIRGLVSTKAILKNEIAFLAITSVMIVLIQIMILSLDNKLQTVIEAGSYVAMFAMMIWLVLKSLKNKNIFLASAFFLWSTLAMYSSSDFYYNAAMTANCISFPLMFLAINKETEKYDLC